jgi:hypothetical protein
MNKEDFELLGFITEILPSGYINISNKQPFRYNGSTTIICYKGGHYIRTTNHKTLDSLFSGLFELNTIEPSSVNPAKPVKKKTKATTPVQEDAFEPLTNQDLTAFLVSSSEAPVKPKRRRKA